MWPIVIRVDLDIAKAATKLLVKTEKKKTEQTKVGAFVRISRN